MTSIRVDSETILMYHKRLKREKREQKERLAGNYIHVSSEIRNIGTVSDPVLIKVVVDGTRSTEKVKMSKKLRRKRKNEWLVNV